MTNALVSFIQPHFIDILGEDGLTAGEIAQSLDIPREHVVQKLNRGWSAKASKAVKSFNITIAMKNNINGLDVEEFHLNTRAAKAFVAQYQNDMGFKYLDFLFDCEQAATEILPKIIAENEALKSSLARATKPLQIKASKKGCLLVPEFIPNIFGQLELIFKWKKKTDISEKEQQLAREKKITESLLGLTTALKDVQDKLAAHELKEKQEAYERLTRQ